MLLTYLRASVCRTDPLRLVLGGHSRAPLRNDDAEGAGLHGDAGGK